MAVVGARAGGVNILGTDNAETPITRGIQPLLVVDL